MVTIKQQEGTMLRSCEIVHLDPSWINKLLRCLTDHRLLDPARNDWWEKEMVAFIDDGLVDGAYDDFFMAHENYRVNGTLSRDYLRFLWREVDEIKADQIFLESLVDTIASHGIMLPKTPPAPGSYDEFLVPCRLPPDIDPSALQGLQDATRGGRRRQYRWMLGKHAPIDIIGLVLTECLSDREPTIHVCWRSGVAFAMSDLEWLVCLNVSTPDGDEESRTVWLELSVAASGESMPLQAPADNMKTKLLKMMRKHFSGTLFRQIPPKAEVTRGERSWEACFRQMREHLDVQLGLFGVKLEAALETTRSSLAKITVMHDASFPFPALVIVRPEKEADRKGRIDVDQGAWYSKRALRELSFKIRRCVSTRMRLFFVCPYDFSEVPCGRDGVGYPFEMQQEWCRKLFPALQVRWITPSQNESHRNPLFPRTIKGKVKRLV
ncbi:MAG: hypothetical protein AAF357_16460 [Verrucomicrobiota bacterium]